MAVRIGAHRPPYIAGRQWHPDTAGAEPDGALTLRFATGALAAVHRWVYLRRGGRSFGPACPARHAGRDRRRADPPLQRYAMITPGHEQIVECQLVRQRDFAARLLRRREQVCDVKRRGVAPMSTARLFEDVSGRAADPAGAHAAGSRGDRRGAGGVSRPLRAALPAPRAARRGRRSICGGC